MVASKVNWILTWFQAFHCLFVRYVDAVTSIFHISFNTDYPNFQADNCIQADLLIYINYFKTDNCIQADLLIYRSNFQADNCIQADLLININYFKADNCIQADLLIADNCSYISSSELN